MYHRRTKFFISHVSSLLKNVLCPVTFLEPKSQWSHLLYAESICHFHSLRGSIETIVSTILSGRTTHIQIFFIIALVWIHLTNAFRFQKWLRIVPSNFFLEWLLIVLAQNQVSIRIIRLQLVWQICYRWQKESHITLVFFGLQELLFFPKLKIHD